jgi:hypothetical protein
MSDTVPSDETGAPEGASAAAVAAGRDEDPSALVTRLRVIEDQPLETRAESLAQLHDELRAMLEAGDAPPHA